MHLLFVGVDEIDLFFCVRTEDYLIFVGGIKL